MGKNKHFYRSVASQMTRRTPTHETDKPPTHPLNPSPMTNRHNQVCVSPGPCVPVTLRPCLFPFLESAYTYLQAPDRDVGRDAAG